MFPRAERIFQHVKRRRLLLLLGVVALAVTSAFALAAYYLTRPFQGWKQPALVDVRPGTSSLAIAVRLRAAGVLRREWPFLLLHYLLPGQTLKAGEYYFTRALSPWEVLGKLRRGEVRQHGITIPEGYNIFEVIDAVAASGLVSEEEIRPALRDTALIADLDPSAENLEGYLFPDTYYFTRHTSAAAMVKKMVARFRKVYGELERRHSASRPVREIVILASLVEKETGLPEERRLVAGVFHNRLKTGLPLQCDPTVVYAALQAGRYRGAILQSDLQFNSPYNTYRRRGLPPGPIANPGREALEAAMAPASTDYLYFVSNAESGHVFSTNLRDHSRAVAEYRRKTNRPRSRGAAKRRSRSAAQQPK